MRTGLDVWSSKRCVLRCARHAAVLCALGASHAAAQEQLLFPWRDNVSSAIIAKINAETVRIDIATWYLTERGITNALISRHNAGVRVRVIGDRVSVFEIDALTRREFEYLAGSGVPIRLRYFPTSFPYIMHWKAGIFAGQRVVEFGSANWTPFELRPASSTNFKDETAMFTADSAIVAAFRSRFDRFWADTANFLDWPEAYERETGQPWTVPMTIDRGRLEPDVSGPSAMIWEQGPVLNNRMAAEIGVETRGVDAVIYRLTNAGITSALVNRLNAGVPVRVMLEPTQYRQIDWPEYWLTGARVDQLWAAGAEIKERDHDGLTHMKVLITSRYAMHGSSNFTNNWQRDHNYFIPAGTKPAFYHTLRDEFDRMWNDAANYRAFYPKPPTAPALAAPVNDAAGVPAAPRLEWRRTPWAVAFDVYLGTSSSSLGFQGRVNAVLTESPPPTYSWTPSVALQPGTRYFWRVVARTFATDADSSLIAASPTRSFVTSGASAGSLSMNRATLRFAAILGSATATLPQTVFVTQQGPPSTWTAGPSQPWLQVSPSSGSGSGAVAVRLTPGYRFSGAGEQSATITVALTGNPSVADRVQVFARVYSSTTAPFGAFDTPPNGSTNVTGAIPVTGWALDDVEVRRVEVWRSAVAGEGTAQIFLGQAVLVADARPDIEVANPNHPFAYRAGWGYMLLTNMLPDQVGRLPAGGNGPFTLHAYAVDAEGRRTLLGSKGFTAANTNAVRPFGTIDTPAQGGVVSGRVMNFAWALSPGGSIPEDGSTITVYVDGVAMGHPRYGQHRDDIATLFPGYTNSSGAVGYFELDTTRLSNGVHTLAWSVTDVQGRTEGIGSRYFTVANGGAAVMSVASAETAQPGAASQVTVTGAGAPTSAAPAVVSSGFDGERRMAYPERTTSAVRVTAPVLEPVRLELGAEPGVTYKGFLRVGDSLRPLPIGSDLDARTGTFTWQPGPAFSGTYELLFVRVDSSGDTERIPVIVSLISREGRHGADRPQR